jgi:NADH dehydrogenase
VVIIGGGFAGYSAARSLARRMQRRLKFGRSSAPEVEILLINSSDYFLYLPLLPEVAAGILEPRRVCVPLATLGPDVRVLLGAVDSVDIEQRRVNLTDPEGHRASVSYDRLLLTVGSVNKLVPIPGVAEHAYPFRSIGEALRLRDHIVEEVELGHMGTQVVIGDDQGAVPSPGARRTFVVVGAGYTGTEVAAQGQLLSRSVARQRPHDGKPVRWLLIDRAPRVLPELDERLSRAASKVLRKRGIEVRTGTTIVRATDQGVLLSDGEFVPTRSLIWCVGVGPDPLIDELGLRTVSGRLAVDDYLTVPGRPGIFACGDAAGVPDHTRPGQLTAMTAQHAVRQGRRAAGNIAASLGDGHPREPGADRGRLVARCPPPLPDDPSRPGQPRQWRRFATQHRDGRRPRRGARIMIGSVAPCRRRNRGQLGLQSALRGA